MKISNGISLKLFLISIFILTGIFSLFFISNTKVRAQTENKIIVRTTGYSVLSPNNFVFIGSYSGNFDKKGFTTNFEFKKYNSKTIVSSGDLSEYFNSLDEEKETTIEIVRKTTADEADVFFTSPELNLFSTYYFRAVGCIEEDPIKGDGCIKDNSVQKFYGDVMSLSTGTIPYGATYTYPYSFDVDTGSDIQNGDASQCKITETFTSSGCKEKTTGTTPDSIPNTPPEIPIITGSTQNADPAPNLEDFSGGLVKCGTAHYPIVQGDPKSGMVSNPCGFKDIMELINTVIKFLLQDIVLPLAAIMFAYAGFELVTSGGSTEKKSKAKKIFTDVAIGLVIIVAAFLIIQTILSIVGYTEVSTWNKL
ncbi:hypothetical protein COX93_03395 [Candidatus Nomurabacteria bacterium CG_4_10_14_0_2_um_filter_30_12]|uniref:SbsA Ig-like domain-containing protein n=2 Tax=Candidatus Nomuraibacteriota TaxID=1752729 RepID=A0A2J0MEX8_9BACT|nr:MAG: hypothetical protein COU48_01160 [Candidatus Nomurabacteria bacterium CG10_big_fil_rev_8_21_14_0_10_03_31_7]PIZ86724.1 MAG: hypothetical protein COX93_03395 [Candidatus Nomurabacteria bacterium CG_4_10_14_0_2_um_filter_30_12]